MADPAREPVATEDRGAPAEAPASQDISVLMPCRNGMPWLPWAVDDLARSTGCRLEILVCDDGSVDGSGEWLQALEATLAPGRCADGAPRGGGGLGVRGSAAACDPVLLQGEGSRSDVPPGQQAFVSEEPWPGEAEPPPGVEEVARRVASAGHTFRLLASHGRGQGAAQNACLFASTAPLVSLMDADDRSEPDRFERLAAALEAKRGEGWHGACTAVRAFGLVSQGLARYIEWQNSLQDPQEMMENRFVEIPGLHQTGLYPRHVMCDLLGGYRDIPSHPIDKDTWMRMAEFGLKIGKIPERLYGWRQHVLQSTRNHGRCSLEHLRRCNARFLLRALPPDVSRLEVWSVGATVDLWREALEAALRPECQDGWRAPGDDVGARPSALCLVEWRAKHRRRGGQGRGQAEAPRPAGGEAAPVFATVERRTAPPGEAVPAVPQGGEGTARVFVFGSREIREQARAAIEGAAGAAAAEGRRGRWARLDWPAA